MAATDEVHYRLRGESRPVIPNARHRPVLGSAPRLSAPVPCRKFLNGDITRRPFLKVFFVAIKIR